MAPDAVPALNHWFYNCEGRWLIVLNKIVMYLPANSQVKSKKGSALASAR